MSARAGPQTVVRSVVGGTAVVALAMLAVRALAAVQRPVLAYLFARLDGHDGEIGMGLAFLPYPVYYLLLSLSTSGVNVALARIVSRRSVNAGPGAAAALTSRLLPASLGAGLLLGGLLWTIAPWLASLAGRPEMVWGMRALAFSLVLVLPLSIYRGHFQGTDRADQYALLQVIEQVVRLGAALWLVVWLGTRGVVSAATGVNIASAVGVAAALALAAYTFRSATPPLRTQQQEESLSVIFKELLSTTLPMVVIGATIPLFMLLDTLLVIPGLTSGGLQGSAADRLFGQLSNALAIMVLPGVISSGLYLNLVPGLSKAIAQGDSEAVTKQTMFAATVVGLIGLPCAVGLAVLHTQIYHLIYPGYAGEVLGWLAPAVLFMMAIEAASGVLHGTEAYRPPAVGLLLGVLVKGAVTWWLTRGVLGVFGASIGTVLGLVTMAVPVLWAAQTRHRFCSLIVTKQVALAATVVATSSLALRWGLNRFGLEHSRLATLAGLAVIAVIYLPFLWHTFGKRFFSPNSRSSA